MKYFNALFCFTLPLLSNEICYLGLAPLPIEIGFPVRRTVQTQRLVRGHGRFWFMLGDMFRQKGVNSESSIMYLSSIFEGTGQLEQAQARPSNSFSTASGIFGTLTSWSKENQIIFQAIQIGYQSC